MAIKLLNSIQTIWCFITQFHENGLPFSLSISYRDSLLLWGFSLSTCVGTATPREAAHWCSVGVARASTAALVSSRPRRVERAWLRTCVVVACCCVAVAGARHGARVAARMCARSEAVELEVLGPEGAGEPRAPPRPLRLSLLDLLSKLVRRPQPTAPHHTRAKHNHRFRTFVSCGLYRWSCKFNCSTTATQ